MKFNKKLFLIIALIAMSIGLIFMFTETISPRNDIVQVSLEKSDFIQITKTEKIITIMSLLKMTISKWN